MPESPQQERLNQDLGLGGKLSERSHARLLNHDGSFNVRRNTFGPFHPFNVYHTLVSLPVPRLVLLMVGGYLATNLAFAAMYWLAGPDAISGATFAAVYYANMDRGVPMATVILGIFRLFWWFIAARTRFGRHVYAVGGSAGAARRAGLNVDRLRIAVFMINGFMAGVGGIVLASRLRSVATSSGGGDLLLNVIAAAVIGGTSLCGGVGRVVSSLLGAVVIASINSGMNLLGLPQGTRSIITGLVLLVAVPVDALSKRARASRGLS